MLHVPSEAPSGPPPLRKRIEARLRSSYLAHPGRWVLGASLVLTLLLLGAYDLIRPPAVPLSQARFNEALEFALEERPRDPSLGSVAYATIIDSLVKVEGYEKARIGPEGEVPSDTAPAEGADLDEMFSAIGTGVVIDELGTILTNYHVARAAPFLRITFADGTQTEGLMVGVSPESDLAVIRPATFPEGVRPAVINSSESLAYGDDVFAVGFPFGIGPSLSAGVVSGLERVLTQDGKPQLSGLIQFDAAANPGNSGGPLVNADGEVVGLVTAILNPSGARTWAGIGFAVPIETAAGQAGDSPL